MRSKIIVQGIFDLLKLVLVAQVLPGTIKEFFDNQKNVFLHTFIIYFVKVQPPRLFLKMTTNLLLQFSRKSGFEK